MRQKGCQILRHTNNKDSALKSVDGLANKNLEKSEMMLILQANIVNDDVLLTKT